MKLDINNKKIGNFTIVEMNTLLNKQQVKEEIKKYLETRRSGNTIYQNLWNKEKANKMDKLLPKKIRKKSENHIKLDMNENTLQLISQNK